MQNLIPFSVCHAGPAFAGYTPTRHPGKNWIPACAGMTKCCHSEHQVYRGEES